jgi:hypothetical protein
MPQRLNARILFMNYNEAMRTLKHAVILILALISSTALAGQAGDKIEVSARFFRLAKAIDVMSIKAIGSPDTKASPSILQVAKTEATRISDLVLKAGGILAGSPKALVLVDEEATISTEGDQGGYKLQVRPSTRGSDTITLNFRLSITTIVGKRKTSRSATAFARLQESKALLVIVNPREGEPGILAIIEVRRSSAAPAEFRKPQECARR